MITWKYVELIQKEETKESKPRVELGKAGKAEVYILAISTSWPLHCKH
jgi:hypothetical protein